MAGKGAGGRGHLMGQIFSGYVFFLQKPYKSAFFKKKYMGSDIKGNYRKNIDIKANKKDLKGLF